MTTAQHPPRRILIVGAGLAGASAAAALREQGFDGDVTLFGQESHDPYELPPLSKGVLLGERDEPDWVREAGYYGEHGIALRRDTTVTALRPADHVIVDADGVEHGYDRLLLATGSRPRTLPGFDGPGVHMLRTLDNALALREKLTDGARVVIVGAGWIGCEVASAARAHGAHVTMVDPVPLPLRNVLGDQVGSVFRDLHADHGVTLRLGVRARGTRPDGRAVLLEDGSELPADVVVVGAGAVPRTELAEAAGLDLAAGGIAVDAALRTSAPDVYAAGDVAAHDHPRHEGRVRVEHWSNAKDQGTHVAGNLLGGHDAYGADPYFFSDQYDLGCEYRGLADPAHDELVLRGDPDSREFLAFWLRDGRVTAALNVNLWDHGDALTALVGTRARVSARQLAEADLNTLTTAGAADRR
ncbi:MULTISPECIES: NAD(P)/FAD-dependent oxidoreductase [unclassified Streptomyces]|uniref:NAD(P)/FAD-dependent oxidoreductase n=1 Tax=Streptomyces salinarius TaxID=2762598 RepID=A0ABW8B5U2_9ACTN|nr:MULTISPECIES: FAD-dependent oxidoreductase [unclassified Streptomyces]WKX23081.1 FAD-dependent oxidoreductase [Streptomyces sp. HUAS CX7]